MSDLVCPACGEEDELRGEPVDDADAIDITCETCATTWRRDVRPQCPSCHGDKMEAAIKAVVEKSRGSQLSIVATQVVHLCKSCDAAVLASYRISRSPLMPDELPTA